MIDHAINYLKSLDPKIVTTIPFNVQYDFFETKQETEIDMLMRRMAEVEVSTGKVRRGLYAENGALKKRMLELEMRLEILERHICIN